MERARSASALPVHCHVEPQPEKDILGTEPWIKKRSRSVGPSDSEGAKRFCREDRLEATSHILSLDDRFDLDGYELEPNGDHDASARNSPQRELIRPTDTSKSEKLTVNTQPLKQQS